MVIDLQDIEQIILPINVYRLVSESILENESQILDLNRRQMFAGNDANGNTIKPQYKYKTVKIKEEKGQPTDRVTLLDTGDFYNSMFLNPFGDPSEYAEFEFDAKDYKTTDLKDKYGDFILGIERDDLDDAAEIIKDTLIESYANELRK